jgi:diacylglycerol kinase (ATP)
VDPPPPPTRVDQVMNHQPALLIANPHSRRGATALHHARQVLVRHGFSIEVPPWHPERLSDLIRARAPEVRAVIVAGGDGTLNAAAAGLIDTGLPLGILPAGTANDLARTLGIPVDFDAAAQIIADGKLRHIDVGIANDVPFFNVASIGFGVDLARALTRDSKHRWGVLGYALAALRTLRRMQPFTAWVEHGGEVHQTRTIHLAVGNGRHYGGGMTIASDARIDDHRLDIFSLEVSSIWSLLRLLPALRSGRHQAWAEIRTLAGQVAEVRTRRPRSVNTDGEIRTRTPVRFSIRTAAIAVFVPTAFVPTAPAPGG